MLSDYDLLERRAAKTGKAARSGDREAQREMAVAGAAAGAAEGGRSRASSSGAGEEPLFRELALVTDRPVLYVLNVGDEAAAAEDALAPFAGFVAWARGRGDDVVAVPGAWNPSSASWTRMTRRSSGRSSARRPAVDALIRASYHLLGYITFFTGDFKSSESRAWQLVGGSSAREAAGRIHSDIAARFVRAEVVPIEDLIAAGSFHAAKERGVLRIEGKDYVVATAT